MRRYAVIAAIAVVAAGSAWFVARPSGGPEPAHAARSAQQAAPVSIVAATLADTPIIRRAIGFAEPIAIVALKSRIDGVIATQNVREGQEVKEGDILFTLDDRELKAQIARDQAAIERDKATVAQKRADLARQQNLVAKGAGTQQALDQAVADEATAAATVKSDEAALVLDQTRLTYATITAPIAGRLGAINATPGNAVRANDASSSLVTITEMAPIRVSFTMPERELGQLQEAFSKPEKPVVRAFSATTKEQLGEGRLVFIDSAVDIPSGTVNAKALFPNEQRKLWPGQYVDVDITLAVTKDSVHVPAVAVQQGQQGPFVYVLKPDSTVEARNVKVVANENGIAALSMGVSANDQVVTEGQSRLAPGVKVRATPPTPESAPPVAATTQANG